MKNLLALLFLLGIILLACQDHLPTTPTTGPTSTTSTSPTTSTTSTTPTTATTATSPTTSRFRIIKATLGTYEYWTYKYNAQNKLDTATYYFSYPQRYLYIARYDAQGRLVKLLGPDFGNKPNVSAAYTYDEQGKLTTLGTGSSFSGENISSIAPVGYNNAGQIASVGTTNFIYTNGNVTQVQDTQNNKNYTYQYDDKINPYYGFITSANDGGFGSISPRELSKNNQILPGHVYTYDSNNLPIQATDIFGRNVTYSYEPY